MDRDSLYPNRREFIAKSAMVAGAATLGISTFGAPALGDVLGANDKIRVGFIGVGNRGTQVMHAFMQNKDMEVAALCDVYKPYLTRNRSSVDKRYLESGRIPELGEKFPTKVATYEDYRRLLDQKDIDAVVIATPDHWHALQTIDALSAGKDIYVEKPLTITIREGRMMLDAQRKTDRVVQVGLNRRGIESYQNLVKKIAQGAIGKVTSAQAYRISNMYPKGIGKMKPEAPPADFNWDMWLGPRAYRPYQYNIAPYYFRWWQDYSSQMGNWGVHYMDAIRWMMGEKAPKAITAIGGKYVLDDDRTIPDTMEVLFEFASGAMVRFSIYEGSSGTGIPSGEIEVRGTKGTVISDMNGYRIEPARGGQFQDWKQMMEPVVYKPSEVIDSSYSMARNFLDCVKSRNKPWCTLEDGYLSTNFAHLANISLAVGARIEWDAEKEVITNHKKANELLHYEYRKEWRISS